MINFKKLTDTSTSEILDCFNHSFSDYIVPMKLDIQQLKRKLFSENINKEISVGAYKSNKLIGLILHGERIIDTKIIAYNAGTGVIPKERGNALTKRMYQYILPTFRAKSFNRIVLEVISDNVPAIRSYQKVGFVTKRNLDCFKGEIATNKLNREIKIDAVSKLDLNQLCNFGEIIPTWQNAIETIVNLGDSAQQILAYSGGKLVGYCILNSRNNRILQIAVKKDFRNKQIGSTLLNYIEHNISKKSAIINVDANCKKTIGFFESNNLEKVLSQLEMELYISKT